MICLVGATATVTALSVESVFGLWALSSDLVYVLLFPQFVALFYMRKKSNAYGAVFGFLLGLILRVLCGEPVMDVPAVIKLPMYDDERGQQFPFRTMCMLVSLIGVLLGSSIAGYLFRAAILPPRLDVCRSFAELHPRPESPTSAAAEAATASDAAPVASTTAEASDGAPGAAATTATVEAASGAAAPGVSAASNVTSGAATSVTSPAVAVQAAGQPQPHPQTQQPHAQPQPRPQEAPPKQPQEAPPGLSAVASPTSADVVASGSALAVPAAPKKVKGQKSKKKRK
ncbi:hypothetical protein V5799_013533 [Amblyomma americanum]|uniref:Uncharacterized protein n=1 Tax=Amblyomma americanum TaxID=6943 RepID=A0AAQ4E5L7_AMBAM